MSTSTETVDKRSALAGEKVLGKAYDSRLMLRLWQFVRPHWRLLLVALALIPTSVGLELVQPLLLRNAIDQYIEAGRVTGSASITLGPIAVPVGSLAMLALVYLGFVVLWALAEYAQLYAIQLLGQRSMHDLRLTIYGHVLEQRAAFFDRMPVGRLLTRMTNDVESINEMFASGVITLVGDVFKLVAIFVAMLLLDVKLTLITFVVMPLLVVVVEYSRRIMRTSFRAIRVKLAAINSFTQEHLSGIKVIQLFARQRVALSEYNEINEAYRKAYQGVIRADAFMYALVEAISIVSIACIAWYAAGGVGAGGLTIGLVVAFVEYVRKFFIPVRDFSAKYTVMQGAMAASERIMSLLDDNEPDPARQRSPSAPARLPEPSPGAPAVRFDDVHFAYRQDEPVLRGVGFDIPRGSTVAVVGATGSGKSTLIKLLARLYEVDKGKIELAGTDIRDLPGDELRGRITVVSQDVFLFAGNVAENVSLGNADADKTLLHNALDRVGASRMLTRRLERDRKASGNGDGAEKAATSAPSMADLLAIEVGERGSNFSAGERQLIAFARALARDPEVLVLDEATAHVDPEAEALIEQGVAELMRGRTTLVIAHRLSTIRNADEIVVMSRGTIVERGTHDELVQRGGVYARLERTFWRRD